MNSKAKILGNPNPYPRGNNASKASESQSPEHHSLFTVSNATSGELCEPRRHSAQSKEVKIQKLFPVVSPYPFRILSNLDFYDEAIATSCISAGGTRVDSVWYRRIAAIALLEYQYPSSVIRMARAARSYAIPHVRMFFLSLRPLETVHVLPKSMLEPTNV
jgi:hypothetical protein